jgi:hypothetical protein
MRYRRRPQTVEAVQWTGENLEEVRASFPKVEIRHPVLWLEGTCYPQPDQLVLPNPDYDDVVPVGHWIVRLPGRFVMMCSNEEFKREYKPVRRKR